MIAHWQIEAALREEANRGAVLVTTDEHVNRDFLPFDRAALEDNPTNPERMTFMKFLAIFVSTGKSISSTAQLLTFISSWGLPSALLSV